MYDTSALCKAAKQYIGYWVGPNDTDDLEVLSHIEANKSEFVTSMIGLPDMRQFLVGDIGSSLHVTDDAVTDVLSGDITKIRDLIISEIYDRIDEEFSIRETIMEFLPDMGEHDASEV